MVKVGTFALSWWNNHLLQSCFYPVYVFVIPKLQFTPHFIIENTNDTKYPDCKWLYFFQPKNLVNNCCGEKPNLDALIKLWSNHQAPFRFQLIRQLRTVQFCNIRPGSCFQNTRHDKAVHWIVVIVLFLIMWLASTGVIH